MLVRSILRIVMPVEGRKDFASIGCMIVPV